MCILLSVIERPLFKVTPPSLHTVPQNYCFAALIRLLLFSSNSRRDKGVYRKMPMASRMTEDECPKTFFYVSLNWTSKLFFQALNNNTDDRPWGYTSAPLAPGCRWAIRSHQASYGHLKHRSNRIGRTKQVDDQRKSLNAPRRQRPLRLLL